LIQRSKDGECLHCGDKSHQVRNCPKINFRRRSKGSGSGKERGHSKGHFKGGRGKPSSRVKAGVRSMEEEPQDESWEGDVMDDSEWYENEVDEYLSLYTLQSQLESREWGEPFSDSDYHINED